jgi:hypothetical protein
MQAMAGRYPECGEGVAASVAYAATHPSVVLGPGRMGVAAGLLGAWCLACAVPPALMLLTVWWRPPARAYLAAYFASAAVSRVAGAAALGGSLGLLWNAGLRRPAEDPLRAGRSVVAAAIMVAAVLDLAMAAVVIGAWARFPSPSGLSPAEEGVLSMVHSGLEMVVVAGGWRYFWRVARARREPAVEWMATVLAAVAVLMDLVVLGTDVAQLLGGKRVVESGDGGRGLWGGRGRCWCGTWWRRGCFGRWWGGWRGGRGAGGCRKAWAGRFEGAERGGESIAPRRR